MSMRRFSRLTNAFSRTVEDHMKVVSLPFMQFNLERFYKSLRVTRAMEGGVSERL
jgi:hypothetical protein